MKKHSQIALFSVFLCVLFLNLDCKKNPVGPPPETTFAITVTEVNCTEVYLQITLGATLGSRTLTLVRDTIQLLVTTIATGETAFTDTNLLPNHTYNYIASLSGGVIARTQAKTMDTTSHSFTWQTYTLGDGSSSSSLFDVAIINDTLAYAVGEIYLNDTLYNLAKWNGQTWNLQQAITNFRGNNIIIPFNGVFAFSPADIWFIGSLPIHGDGQNWTIYDLRSMAGLENISLSKAWGTSSSSMYFVGLGGSVAHYNGTSWTSISSGTSLDVRDIWGAQNTKTGNLEIYATAGNPIVSDNCAILQISGTTAQAISTVGISTGLNGLWFSPGQYYWIVGDGIWEKHPTLSASTWSYQTLTSNEPEAVRGNALNDVFMCGAYGEMLHYNGVTWKSYISQTGINGAYLGLSVKGNTVIAVGEEAPQAVILMGKRQ